MKCWPLWRNYYQKGEPKIKEIHGMIRAIVARLMKGKSIWPLLEDYFESIIENLVKEIQGMIQAVMARD